MTPSVALFAYVLGMRVDAEKTQAFFEVMETGVSKLDNDPRLMLRESLLNHKMSSKKLIQEDCAALTVKAMNLAFMNGRGKILKWSPKQESFPRFIPLDLQPAHR